MTIFTAFSLLAQATPAAGQPAPNPLGMVVPMVCIGVIFYFLMIRPQQKKQKDQAALVQSAKTGDKVITVSGIHGMITNVKETTVMLKIDDNVKIEVEKSSIGTVKRKEELAA